MHFVKAGFECVHQRDVKPVLPDTDFSVRFHAVFMPSAIWGEDEVIRTQGHLMAIDDCVSTAAFHDKTQRRCGVPVGGCCLTRMHDLKACIQPTYGSRDMLPAWIIEIDDPASSLFRSNEVH
ncbi:hypothetical protein D3C85_1247470 [compost metagenome]